MWVLMFPELYNLNIAVAVMFEANNEPVLSQPCQRGLSGLIGTPGIDLEVNPSRSVFQPSFAIG